ncbi:MULTISPECIES: SDR family NAD(P)-dependent oxidoreductase [Klebsiella]|jgi:NAD(P)-dependent dehydrogenase (short-subunit alcohol dehydrogenase family)|uniref:3-oxoacyl-[acyl-carrier protein] reductase n=1 Tax=Klebsiella oxytoca TaxID=571 RepID=A0A6C0L509_KLEOX|nr:MULTISPECIES: glucose 1-dehydrogenase [Klebsiella]HBQ5882091.1 glucose 1-dehydrogenase [Klebsiella pneumoniae subsp. pneumoniae]HBS3522465.1 glucose 1-dehydrogenase [Klebsiella variicola subsp. variicola]HCQ8039508.1 glucose 1-dehydrogenase [Klebsiella quasipneumoniae subsp. quasipneumoniae]ELS4497297.1 glucose 1-dehydrogenase [Klebsiella michiganensis]ELS4630272.1 glucose 1-dehydrogenase [Klebsiella michiganensis]
MISEPVNRNLSMAGKVCIVTGAASGIGRAISRQLAANGAQVVVADITTEVIEGGVPTAELILEVGHKAVFIHTDVAETTQVDALIQETVSCFGRLDVLVNNACIRHARSLLDMEEKDWNRVLDVNLNGVYRCCRAAIRQMVQQSLVDETRGRIINLSSQHGMIAAPQDLAYGVSKAAIDYLTRQVATDYASQQIVCNAVAPGKIQTGAGGRAIDPTVIERATRRTPWPRLGRPEDIARAVLFLASSEASFITGATLMVDGGWMAA